MQLVYSYIRYDITILKMQAYGCIVEMIIPTNLVTLRACMRSRG